MRRPPVRVPDKVEIKLVGKRLKQLFVNYLNQKIKRKNHILTEVGALWARLQRFTTYFKPAQSHRYALQIIQIISNAMPPCK